MDKRAQKLKQKRRMEREEKRNEKLNNLWNEMTEYANEHNLAPLEKTKEHMLRMYKATKEVDSKILNKSAVIALVCSLYVLYIHYNYDTNMIMNYAKKLRNFLIRIGNNKRSIVKIIEEIENDYNVAIVEKCKTLPTLEDYEFKKYNMEDTIIKSTIPDFPYFIAVNAYTFMNDICYTQNVQWNSTDLNIFISESFILYEQILNNCSYLNELYNQLLKELKISVDLNNGTVKEIILQ